MPAKSKAQQKAAGAALAAKRGAQSPSALKGPSRQMYESMSEQQLDEFASTGGEAKPERVSAPTRPAKKAPAKAANKAKKKAATTKGKTSKAKTKAKRAKGAKPSPPKAAKRRK